MRYSPDHKLETHQKIVKDASRRIRAEGLTGPAVSTIMRDAGLTHGGFYKHFESKEDLLKESLSSAFQQIADVLTKAAGKSRPNAAWKTIVNTYLSPEHCDHGEVGCPIAALASELARADKPMKSHVLGELGKYRGQIIPYMPGRRASEKEHAFISIFSTMIGAISIARLLPDPKARDTVLATAREFLLRSF